MVNFVLAMATPGDPAGWTAFIPFALILGIFYFLILLPMKRRQKKVQEFQDALKVNDKVVMVSGIHGLVTKVSDKSVQLQISDNPKVRIEVARQSIGGYQGQEPVVQEPGS